MGKQKLHLINLCLLLLNIHSLKITIVSMMKIKDLTDVSVRYTKNLYQTFEYASNAVMKMKTVKIYLLYFSDIFVVVVPFY